MRIFQLVTGENILVDDDIYEQYSNWKWRLSNNGYVHITRWIEKKVKIIYLHRLITNCPGKLQVDHIDHNKLNNQRINLRICTAQENRMASKASRFSAIIYKGVSNVTKSNKFRARIKFQGKEIHLGIFSSCIDAALAYDEKAKELFGEFAYTNFN